MVGDPATPDSFAGEHLLGRTVDDLEAAVGGRLRPRDGAASGPYRAYELWVDAPPEGDVHHVEIGALAGVITGVRIPLPQTDARQAVLARGVIGRRFGLTSRRDVDGPPSGKPPGLEAYRSSRDPRVSIAYAVNVGYEVMVKDDPATPLCTLIDTARHSHPRPPTSLRGLWGDASRGEED